MQKPYRMNPAAILKNFNQTFDIWEKALDNYTLVQLSIKPDQESWSLGQVYMHLVEQTLYYNIPQLEICLSSNKNSEGEKSAEGTAVYEQNSFPPVKFKSAPLAFEIPKQPASMELKSVNLGR